MDLRPRLLRLAPVIALLAWMASAPARPVTMSLDPDQAGSAGRLPSDYFYMQRVMRDGRLPSERLEAALEQLQFERALAAKSGGAFASAQDWTPVGPFNVGGRVNALVAAPGGIPAYLGAANGGVFRSMDLGDSWQPITDAFGTPSIGALAMNPLNPATVWVGSGDANATTDGYDGNGVYVTRDAGITWQHRGLRDVGRIGAVAVSPADSNRIYVGALGRLFTTNPERGLYRSLNGGLTWTRTLFVDDSTGVADLAINPAHPDTMFCTTWTRVRRLKYRRAGGAGCGVWRSVDAGATWQRLAGGLPAPGDNVGRISIAVAPSRPSRVYASVTSGAASGYTGAGIYRSDDGGSTWTRVDTGSAHLNAFGGFAWYFGGVIVAPDNPDDIWVLGQTLLRSVNAGVTLTDVRANAHVDMHALWIDPSNPLRVLLGNDGGFYRQSGSSWVKTLQLPITQFYAGSVDPNNANKILGGSQDNGVQKTESGPSGWIEIMFGDGFQTLVHPDDTNILFGELQFGNGGQGIHRSVNNGGVFARSAGWDRTDRYNWNTPFVANPRNVNTMIAGSHRIYKSEDNGRNWAPVSGDLSHAEPSALVYGTITTVAVSNADTSLYLAGTDDSRVWRSQDAGATWEEITLGLPELYVTAVAADPNDPNVIYVAHSGFGQDQHDPRVFRSANRGTTWTPISGNLPDAPVNDLIVDPVLSGTLYAATDLGVFVTRNLGETWTALGGAMPIQPVWDLVLHSATRQLFAFTHGRSAWKLDLGSVPLSVPGARTGSGLALGTPAPNPMRASTRLELAIATRVQVRVNVFDASGRMIRALHHGALDPGRHSLVWDASDERGSRVRPGVYFVRASDGVTSRTQRVVVAD